MNIAIFSPNKNPYSETFIQAHKQYLKGNIFYYYGSIGGIQLEGTQQLASKILQLKFRLIRKLNNYPFSFINEQLVKVSLKTHGINVILIEYGTHAHSLLSLLKTSNLPVVVHFHGYDASIDHVIERCNHYKEVFKIASSVIVVSEFMKAKLLDLGCPSDKLVYNVYGPSPDYESVVPFFLKKQFICIGRFTDKKAPYYTILAFMTVAKKHPNARLLLAGDGVLLNSCINLVRYNDLESQVVFLGVITPETYQSLLSESLAFVQHSITADNGDMEGTPLAVLEASAAGIPVISTIHAGIPDVIIHGKTGLLCEEHDVDMMSKHMLRLFEDVSYAKELGRGGKARVKMFFSMDKHINALQQVLEAVVK